MTHFTVSPAAVVYPRSLCAARRGAAHRRRRSHENHSGGRVLRRINKPRPLGQMITRRHFPPGAHAGAAQMGKPGAD
jgi:hypothetical protein